MGNIGPTFIAVLGGVLTLAIVAVLVSKKAQTPAVFTGAGQALSSVIAAAVSPLGGGGTNQFGSSSAPAGTTQ